MALDMNWIKLFIAFTGGILVALFLVNTTKTKSMTSNEDFVSKLVYADSNCPTCECQKPDTADIFSSLTGPSIKADNPRLISAIAHHMIDHPRPYVSKFSYPLFETPQAKEAMAILNKKNGFFVEAGGLDGERSSNTIYLENKHGWNGLLVEMDPSWYMQIRGKNRKCYSINACLSPNDYPVQLAFQEHKMGEGKLVQGNNIKHPDRKLQHQAVCFPLYSIMLALNRTKIDYFSLDVEGMELPILRSIPFDKLDITIVNVEYVHGKEGEQAYIDFMKSKGYRFHKRIKEFKPEIYFGCNDFVFVKETFYENR